MAATHEIVIIGASFAGLTVASNLLRDILPAISSSGKEAFKVTLINPTKEFLWKIGLPRTIVNPTALPLDKALTDIEPYFTKYGPEKFQFIQAYASSIDPTSKTVKLSTETSVKYDSLVICSGTGFNSDLWSTTPGVDHLRSAIEDIHHKLPAAETIYIAGGGPAGVETAGEFGDTYASKKDVTLLSGGTQLLNRLNNKNVGKDAESRLQKMNVKVVHDVQVTNHHSENGKEVLQLSNGETKTVDIYIEAIGDKPNSSFVPAEWRTERGQVKTDPQTLRLDVDGVTGVYCFGSVGSYSDGGVMDVMFAKKAMLETLRSDLSGTGMYTTLLVSLPSLMSSQRPALEPRLSSRKLPLTCNLFRSAQLKVSALHLAGSCPASWSRWRRARTLWLVTSQSGSKEMRRSPSLVMYSIGFSFLRYPHLDSTAF